VDLPARSFDTAPPGVAPPLSEKHHTGMSQANTDNHTVCKCAITASVGVHRKPFVGRLPPGPTWQLTVLFQYPDSLAAFRGGDPGTRKGREGKGEKGEGKG